MKTMVIANCEECTDHLTSFHFHAKRRLNRTFTIIFILLRNQLSTCLVENIPEVTFVLKTGFLQKEKFFTI